jgi:hypothetical protein
MRAIVLRGGALRRGAAWALCAVGVLALSACKRTAAAPVP